MRIVVSDCLRGVACRYDGTSKPRSAVLALCAREDVEVLGVCPECAGGLPTPRPPAEIVGERVLTEAGGDVTDAYERGAVACRDAALAFGAELAILKERSPSCGSTQVFDGTHTGTLRAGEGVFARALRACGIPVLSEEDVEAGLL